MKTDTIDLANWMAQLSDEAALYTVMMPGSHDAGMSVLSHCNPFVGAEGSTKTQHSSVGRQLTWGSRYFDIRVDYDHNHLVTYHRSGAFGCNGEALVEVLNHAVQFVINHPTEFALLKFSHIREYGNHHASDTKAKIETLLSELGYQPYIYTNDDPTINLASVSVGELRGKLVILYDHTEDVSTSQGRFYYRDYGKKDQSKAHLVVYDEYSKKDNYDEMASNQITKWRAYGGQGPAYLFLLSWTLTAVDGPFSGSVESLAAKANNELPKVLHEQINTNHLPLPNIIYIDFMNATTARAIVQHNFEK